MGGVRKFPFPKHVWTPYGGWWPNPENWKRNTTLAFVVGWGMTYFIYQWAENNTV
jgi:hypothetical protein